ncbi:hypothetical protein A2Z41_01195 [Microgenomates group bacterium RBG_19FT_COMBO_39_10]|nr:MAG: hypothetical protein A2Z41_01195 [Microgenomates group bacterium RBG_19FT_COMBO_39_10]
MKNTLWKLRLNSDNSIIISSGILQALRIRNNKDIDVVVSQEMFNYLKKSGNFKVIESQGRETLADDMFEIGIDWLVLGKSYKLEDLIKQSLIIEGVRYITLDFLYEVKKSYASDKNVCGKDVEDIKLIENYLSKL